MIQFILILLGLALPNNQTNAALYNNTTIITSQNSFADYSEVIEDTGGETGQLPPPKKPIK